jgi:uncharacterized protein YprB with RNaseH-like and TPR domain
MTDELFAKLKRLRRDRDAVPRDAMAAGAALPEWFKRRLERELAVRAGAASESIASPLPEVGGAEPRTKSCGEPRGLVPAPSALGEHAVRIERCARGERHGAVALDALLSAAPAELAWLANDDALAGLELERVLFLDIETTGLSGGAGTHVFLVGLARFDGDAFELWQGFARGPEEEAALLSNVAERIVASAALVTFFGKSFDRHRLEDKMRVHGIAPPFAERPHLDLYHPLRRLYRGAFADGRLATLERELCGVARSHDLSGAFAPAAWFDFLAGRPHWLEEVFRHNRDDVKSLATLAAHLARARSDEPATGNACSTSGARSGDLVRPALSRWLGLAQLAARRREWSEAERWFVRVESVGPLPEDVLALRARVAARAAR